LLPIAEGAFTIVVIPDTQRYTGKGTKLTPDSTDPVINSNLAAQVQWIRQHQIDQRIAFVSHVGDIVEKDREPEWAIAKAHLDDLRGLVPFSLTVGNHDMSTKGNAERYQSAFPASSFAAYPWYLGSYQHHRADQRVSANNVNSAQTFSAGGILFLHISLECNAPNDVLTWANALLLEHRTSRPSSPPTWTSASSKSRRQLKATFAMPRGA
jgi:Calcineurin-like phosphoesterase